MPLKLVLVTAGLAMLVLQVFVPAVLDLVTSLGIAAISGWLGFTVGRATGEK